MRRNVPQCEFWTRKDSVSGVLCLLLLLLALVPRPASAQTYTVLHEFTAAKGGLIFAGLIPDGKGHFFGVASMGGSTNNGTAFKLGAKGRETVLHNFTGADGSGPNPLLRDAAGNLYGTATVGGDPNCYGPFGNPGCGTVFKISPKGAFTVLHTFTGAPSDGALPSNGGPLTLDSSGNLYGVTWYGGAYSGGMLFKISPTGQMTVLYNFNATSGDAAAPFAGLLLIGNDLYGTTAEGGAYGWGAIFKISTDGSGETVLHSFGKPGSSDGSQPAAGLVGDSAGNFYGTTLGGGTHNDGTVFELAANGQETVLHNFDGTDGLEPAAGLTVDSQGNLYGTAVFGGTGTECGGGCGLVFKLSQSGGKWMETVLHTFQQSEGAFPEPILLLENGYLYGTTVSGGISTCSYPGASGCGVAFKLTP